jgi:hypothetical protein
MGINALEMRGRLPLNCFAVARPMPLLPPVMSRRKANAAIVPSNECNFSFKLTHVFVLGLSFGHLFAR